MECMVVVLCILFIWPLWLQFFGPTGKRLTRDMGEPLARRFHGQFVTGWFGRLVSFQHGSHTASFRRGTARAPFRGTYNELTLPWPEQATSLELVYDPSSKPNSTDASNLATLLASLRSEGNLETREFSRIWQLRKLHPIESRLLLNQTVRAHLESLRRQDNSITPISLAIHTGLVVIRKKSTVTKIDSIEQFIRVALSIYDQLCVHLEHEIEFLDSAIIAPLEKVDCQICGETIHSGLVYCQRCQTPHHQDCWAYNGTCSIYGCGATEYIKPRIAKTHTNSTEDTSTADHNRD
jgi:hypothetical protein